MDDKLIYIPNDDKQNIPFCRLKIFVESLDTNKFNLLSLEPIGKSNEILHVFEPPWL